MSKKLRETRLNFEEEILGTTILISTGSCDKGGLRHINHIQSLNWTSSYVRLRVQTGSRNPKSVYRALRRRALEERDHFLRI
jgi:hypothetical protein